MPIQPGIPLTCPKCGKVFPSATLAMNGGLGTLVQYGNTERCPGCRFSVPVPPTTSHLTPVGQQHILMGYVPKFLPENVSDILEMVIFRLGDDSAGTASFKLLSENGESYLVCRDSPDWKVSFHESGQTHFGFLNTDKAKQYGYELESRHIAKGVRFDSFLGDLTRVVVIDYYKNGLKIDNLKNIKSKEAKWIREYTTDNDTCRFEIYFSSYNPMKLESTKELLHPSIVGLLKVSEKEYFTICAKDIDSSYSMKNEFQFKDKKFKILFGNTEENIFYMKIQHCFE